MSDIYAQHSAAFSRVSAFVILKEGERVANIAFKFPADGAGRLYAYVHWFGTEMVRGFAGGGGYDKKSAAVASAIDRWDSRSCHAPSDDDDIRNFRRALSNDDGNYWDRRLEAAGFQVLQAV